MPKTLMISLGAASAVALAATAAAQAPDHLQSSQLQWRQMLPGVEFAPAYGDWEKEAHGKYVRLAPGAKVPMHTHSHPYRAVMVSGRMANLYSGDQRLEVAPGDFWSIAGAQPHGHECVSSDGCFFYTDSNALWDVQLVDAATK